jgi:hypothetical protein
MSTDGHEERPAVIQPIGRSQPVDSQGFIVNTCSADLIKAPWSRLVSDLLAQCQDELGDSLHSLQLRGSVPRGLAVEGLSDLDVFCITDGRLPQASVWIDRMARRLQALHPFCRGLDLRVWPLCDLVGLPSGHPARFLLKTQGLCIWGPDATADWAPVPLVSAGLKLLDFSRSGHAGLLRPFSSIASSSNDLLRVDLLDCGASAVD